MNPEAQNHRPHTGEELKWLIAIFVLASLVRLGVAWRTHVIARDGATAFVPMAQEIAAGNWRAALRNHQHPLFPIAICGVHLLVPDWPVAAQAAAVLLGALAVFPLYYLTRPVFGRAPAVAAVLVFAFHTHSARYAADVISEPLFMLCILSAGCFGMRAWPCLRAATPFGAQARGHLGWAALTGLAAGLAYLTRPEGLGTLCVAGAWLLGGLLVDLFRKKAPGTESRRVLNRVAAALVMVIACASVAVPYIVALHRDSGEWSLTRKKDLGAIITTGDQYGSGPVRTAVPPGPPPGPRARWRRRVFDLLGLLNDYVHVLNAAIALFLIGIFARRRFTRDRWAELFLANLFAAYFLLHVAVVCLLHCFSKRHALQGVTLLLPWIGVGGAALWQTATRSPRRRLALAARLLLVAVAAVLCANAVEERRLNRRGERVVGLWIRKHGPSPPKLLRLARTRTAFYAGAVDVQPSWEKEAGDWKHKHTFDELHACVRELKPDYVLIHKNDVKPWSDDKSKRVVTPLIPDFFAASREANWKLVLRCSDRGELAHNADAAWWLFRFRWSRKSGKKPGALNGQEEAS